jgi:hypothetical protein
MTLQEQREAERRFRAWATVALTLGGGVVVAEAVARGDRDSSGVGGLPLHPASPQAIAIPTALRMGTG